MTAVDSVDVPAVRGIVLAWVVVWFVLGYALYAMVYGALGSLASRTEDATERRRTGDRRADRRILGLVRRARAGPAERRLAQLVSLFPATAPFAMPARIAMGASTWWEPMLAVILTVAAIAGLVRFGGRVYSGAILHTGPTLKVRDAWRGATSPHGGGTGPMFLRRA